MIRAVVWNEFVHERENAGGPRRSTPTASTPPSPPAWPRATGIAPETATLDEPEHGLPQARLDATDVLLWWGHKAHGAVADAVVDRVVARVHQGMGLIVLHSGHFSKPFIRLMGTPCSLRWREAGERERLWVDQPLAPDPRRPRRPRSSCRARRCTASRSWCPSRWRRVLISWFEGGEVFRSGLT